MSVQVAMTYPFGSLIRLDAIFTRRPTADEIDAGVAADASDWQPVDPGTVTFSTKAPSSTVVAYVHGVDDEVVKVSTGVYYAELPEAAGAAGLWAWKVAGTGEGQSTAEGRYNVAPTAFP